MASPGGNTLLTRPLCGRLTPRGEGRAEPSFTPSSERPRGVAIASDPRLGRPRRLGLGSESFRPPAPAGPRRKWPPPEQRGRRTMAIELGRGPRARTGHQLPALIRPSSAAPGAGADTRLGLALLEAGTPRAPRARDPLLERWAGGGPTPQADGQWGAGAPAARGPIRELTGRPHLRPGHSPGPWAGLARTRSSRCWSPIPGCPAGPCATNEATLRRERNV